MRPPKFNPEKYLPPSRVAYLKGQEDYLAQLESDPLRHYYKPGSQDEWFYDQGYNRELYDCLVVVRGLA